MGGRANFGIKQHNGHTIVIYGHWAGWEMLHHFAVALKTAKDAGRIDDESYAARIIFDSLTEGSDPLRGWGITVDCIQDNEHKVQVFDVDSQTVSLYDCGCSFNLDNPIFTMSVDGFISKFLKQG